MERGKQTKDNAMKMTLWDQRLAAILVRPLVKTPVTPNHVTTLSLAVGLVGAGLLAAGESSLANWGAGLFMVARFLDHFDGELARQSGKTSRFGYLYDYVAGCLSYSALFLALGIGLRDGLAGQWSIVIGVVIAPIILTTTLMAIKYSDESGGDSDDYPVFAGFELEDGIYLIGPIVWAGWIEPFFLLGAAGVVIFAAWTGVRFLTRGRQG
ncbi:MAG: CDP-alcohol phosphatidyltransferase family protein [Rhodospirillaceae bacterium]|nr:CDP-alcohol phosphatidyltransferase family protein [Rhodospirillaceae bacterium]MBT5811793.1 CDP-alcohol phosphatidyltransferase family protein [Rhodospirillaceae bacterium]